MPSMGGDDDDDDDVPLTKLVEKRRKARQLQEEQEKRHGINSPDDRGDTALPDMSLDDESAAGKPKVESKDEESHSVGDSEKRVKLASQDVATTTANMAISSGASDRSNHNPAVATEDASNVLPMTELDKPILPKTGTTETSQVSEMKTQSSGTESMTVDITVGEETLEQSTEKDTFPLSATNQDAHISPSAHQEVVTNTALLGAHPGLPDRNDGASVKAIAETTTPVSESAVEGIVSTPERTLIAPLKASIALDSSPATEIPETRKTSCSVPGDTTAPMDSSPQGPSTPGGPGFVSVKNPDDAPKDSGVVPMDVSSAAIESTSIARQSGGSTVVATEQTQISSLRSGTTPRQSKSASSPAVRFANDHPRLPESDSPPPRVREPAWEEVEDAFPLAIKRRFQPSSFNSSRKKQRKTQLVINVAAEFEGSHPVPSSGEATTPQATVVGDLSVGLPTHESDWEHDGSQISQEDSLMFFAETHEEQDPAYILREREKQRQKLDRQLEELKLEAEMGNREIMRRLAVQLQEKQESYDRNRQRVLDERAADEKRYKQKCLQLYNEKLTGSQRKIEESIQLLITRHAQEIKNSLRDHRESAKQRAVPEQMAAAEWASISQRIESRQKLRIENVRSKGEQIKQKLRKDLEREMERIRAHHENRVTEASAMLEKMLVDVKANIEDQKRRHVKSHLDRIRKQRDKIRAEMYEYRVPLDSTRKRSQVSKPKSFLDEMKEKLRCDEFRTASPITLDTDVRNGSTVAHTAAALRHKQRKGVANTMAKQLSLEIHNEGLWLSSFQPEKNTRDGRTRERSTANKTANAEFVPWGLQAQRILLSVSCGEIPRGYGSERFNFVPLTSANGGQIRCFVVDLRCSETTASVQRAGGLKRQEEAAVTELEKTLIKLTETVATAETTCGRALSNEKDSTAAVEKSMKLVAKTEQGFQQLRAKAKDYIGSDDVPIESMGPAERQKLLQALHRHKSNVQTAMNRLDAAQKALKEAQEYTQKMQKIQMQAQRAVSITSASLKKRKALLQERAAGLPGKSRLRLSEAAETERAAARVRDVVSAFGRVAKSRQDQLEEKRGRGSSGWLQDVPGLSSSVRRSLHLRMGRHRQYIMLRPNMDDMLNVLKSSVMNLPLDSSHSDAHTPKDTVLRAEQLFLLAVYPEAETSKIASAPTSHSQYPPETWAEPGWLVNLDVPEASNCSQSLLPCVPACESLQQSVCENLSSQGRQMANALRSSQLMRGLVQPLSVLGQTTSLAERSMSTAVGETVYAADDPLSPKESMKLTGYAFHLKPPGKTSVYGRKKVGARDESEYVISDTSKKQSKTESATAKRALPLGNESTPRRGSSKADKSKRSRSKAASGSDATNRPALARTSSRTESRSRPIIPPPVPVPPLQQPGGSPMSARAIFGQHPSAQQTLDQRAASQYGSSFLKQPPTQQSQHASLQQLQQALAPSPRQLLAQQHHQQYASPQHLRQMAQFRMLHQQQQAQQQQRSPGQPTFSPGSSQQQLQFFPQLMPPPQGATRQTSFPGQQPQMQFPVGHSHAYSPQPLDSNKRNETNDPNDPLHQSKDASSK